MPNETKWNRNLILFLFTCVLLTCLHFAGFLHESRPGSFFLGFFSGISLTGAIVSIVHICLKVKKVVSISLMILQSVVCVCDSQAASAVPGIEFEDCRLIAPGMMESVEAKCGTLQLLENPDDPKGRMLDINVTFIPAKHRQTAPDPLFIIAGGPGQAISEVFPLIAGGFKHVLKDRNLILVDQRGTGKSNPLKCPVPDEPGLSDEELVEIFSQCPKDLDADLRFYTTGYAVRDLEAVRLALGYEKINIYGVSYGTRVALAYLRDYPDRVRSLVLDAVADLPYILFSGLDRSASQSLDVMFARCEADPDCSEAFPELRREFEEVIERLQQNPVEVQYLNSDGEPFPLTMDRQRFFNILLPLLYAPETVSLLPLSIHRAYAYNDYSSLLGQALSSNMRIHMGMFYAVACSEDVPFLPAVTDQTEEVRYFKNRQPDMCRICQSWPRADVPADFHQPVSSDVPTLLISGEADPITPPEYGERVRKNLPNSVHIQLPGMGHGNASRGCLPKIVGDFIQAGSVENLDTSGISGITTPPFFVNMNGPKP